MPDKALRKVTESTELFSSLLPRSFSRGRTVGLSQCDKQSFFSNLPLSVTRYSSSTRFRRSCLFLTYVLCHVVSKLKYYFYSHVIVMNKIKYETLKSI